MTLSSPRFLSHHLPLEGQMAKADTAVRGPCGRRIGNLRNRRATSRRGAEGRERLLLVALSQETKGKCDFHLQVV